MVLFGVINKYRRLFFRQVGMGILQQLDWIGLGLGFCHHYCPSFDVCAVGLAGGFVMP